MRACGGEDPATHQRGENDTGRYRNQRKTPRGAPHGWLFAISGWISRGVRQGSQWRAKLLAGKLAQRVSAPGARLILTGLLYVVTHRIGSNSSVYFTLMPSALSTVSTCSA